MSYERISVSPEFDGPVRERHEYRYKFASKHVLDTDIVLDAACGNGYGRDLLNCWSYIGVDKMESADLIDSTGKYLKVDLNTWTPDFEFDVGVSFETLEHLDDWMNLIKILQMSKRLVIISVPLNEIVGLSDSNPFHKQSFTEGQIYDAFSDWKLVLFDLQDNDTGIWIFRRQ